MCPLFLGQNRAVKTEPCLSWVTCLLLFTFDMHPAKNPLWFFPLLILHENFVILHFKISSYYFNIPTPKKTDSNCVVRLFLDNFTWFESSLKAYFHST